MLASANGELNTRVPPNLLLQAVRDLEHAALALDLAQVLLARHVGHIFAKHENAFVARHLVFHADVEQIHHRRRLARELRIVLGVELLARRIDVGRVHAESTPCSASGCGCSSASSVAARISASTSRAARPARLRWRCPRDQPLRERRERIARGIGVTLFLADDRTLRRRRASANTDGSPWRAPTPVPCARGRRPRRARIAS